MRNAEPLYEHASTIAENALGPDHPDVGAYLNDLAVIYRAQGPLLEAEPLVKRALTIAKRAPGPARHAVLLPQLAELLRAGWLRRRSKGRLVGGRTPLLPITVRQLDRV